ncbi:MULTISPECIES: GNAT family N-acetyltransferase [Streptacidiphilus]|uniref:GNAT family N-acetyltransferase n=2 Tax=Streptacidiphilus TaxID=228398 RepID=A0ABV6V0M0_9ACTN|nr:GNAT family N-acetyltransferase [Streptacidiphilus jeojiense]
MDNGLRITDLRRRDELEALGTLLDGIWGAPAPLVPFSVLRALAHCGGMVLGAYDGQGALVGGAVGFRAPDQPSLHSHLVGVDPAHQRSGIGRAVKEHQRQWCLVRGVTSMTWTFDPLVHRNAFFNINRLGALGTAYIPDYYGEMTDQHNRGLPSDRVLVLWDLTDSGHTRADPAPHGEPLLAPGQDGAPLDGGGSARPPANAPVTLRLPTVVHSQHALAWRHALRARMAPLLDTGYRWTAVDRDGTCTLEAGPTVPVTPEASLMSTGE